MYCDGKCPYLDAYKGKCKLDKKRKMVKIKYSSTGLSFVAYEHIGFCEMDGENIKAGD